MEAEQDIQIGPQPGPQTTFLETEADIAFYGGAAGGGKSFGILLDPLRHLDNPKFGAVIFRRTTTQIRNEGGLWDEAGFLYPQLGAQLRETTLEVVFPSRMRVKFAHLEYDKTVYEYQGAQIPAIYFDELTHFTEKQFVYFLSRNRSASGVKGYIRGTCNPDADSWVKEWISWYLDDNGQYARPSRAGKLRWFIRIEDRMVWADSPEEIYEQYGRGPDIIPKSFTFIPSKLQDNKILLTEDPSYLANLNALARVERMRLLHGDWAIKPNAGMYFQKGYFPIIDVLPPGGTAIRYWDRASTKPNPNNKDPDFTAGVKLVKYPNGTWVVAHVARTQNTPLAIEELVRNTAKQDGEPCWIGIEQDPGSAGQADADNYVRMLAGYNVRVYKPTSDKITRALAVSAQAEAGNIKVLKGYWNDAFLNELENFPEGGHDDQVDGLSGAFNELVRKPNDDWMPIIDTAPSYWKY